MSSREARGQAVGIHFLCGALVVVIVGGLPGELLGINQRLVATARTCVRTWTDNGRHLTHGDASQVGSVATAHD